VNYILSRFKHLIMEPGKHLYRMKKTHSQIFTKKILCQHTWSCTLIHSKQYNSHQIIMMVFSKKHSSWWLAMQLHKGQDSWHQPSSAKVSMGAHYSALCEWRRCSIQIQNPRSCQHVQGKGSPGDPDICRESQQTLVWAN
jgi:hypothetical protein